MGALTPAAAEALPAASVGGLAPIRYDDCGSPGRQPHVVGASDWTFQADQVAAPLAARTVAFATDAVHLRYGGLAPGARYALRVTYCTERDGPRVQTLYAGGAEVHGALSLPRGKARTYDYALPAGVAARGVIDLYFRRVSGPNAVVSEVWLLSDRPQPEVSLALAMGAGGRVTATVLDGLLRPVSGAAVRVTATGGLDLASTADRAGQATFALAGRLPRAGDALLTFTAWAHGLTATRAVPADSVVFRWPTLTPIPDRVAGVRRVWLDLCGRWHFNPRPAGEWWRAEAANRRDATSAGWAHIDVPGEWVMEGFTVPAGAAAAYWRDFDAPADWAGHAAIIRFDAVFSQCTVWLNGVKVGQHLGGFTPFEVDATAALRPGRRNTVALAVTSDSLADTLASASSYARHPLGGITRKVTIFAAPRWHLTRFQALTDLDAHYRDATLTVLVEGASSGASGATTSRPAVRLTLADSAGRPVALDGATGTFGREGRLTLKVPVAHPRLWDPEHPNLYTLACEVSDGGKVTERVSRRIGFRKVEVRGVELLVNGRPVKLHGTCRHEVDPTRGRSLTPEVWARDVELLKGANINYVRTSHYPPAEEFLDLCDRAGIFVQEEAPFCWVSQANANSPETRGLILRSTAEMVERDLSHPCVIIWDLANESSWGANFRASHDMVRRADPTRPTLFSGASDADPAHGKPDGYCEIASWHYPGPGFAAKLAGMKRPVTFDEYCHINCYNAAEVALDPGLRDYWGRSLAPMWEEMRAAKGCLGGAVWCWADDVFDVPGVGRVGYGDWGAVDGWRRPKPEWWEEKKVYSPVRIGLRTLPAVAAGQELRVPVENRFLFTDLSEVRIEWRQGRRGGVVKASAPPGGRATISVPATPGSREPLWLGFRDPSGRLVDEYVLAPPQGAPAAAASGEAGATGAASAPGGEVELRREAGGFVAEDGSFRVALNRPAGLRAWIRRPGGRWQQVLLGGPFVFGSALGKATDAFIDRTPLPASGPDVAADGDGVAAHWTSDASCGTTRYTLRIGPGGDLDLTYELRYAGPTAAVREVGTAWQVAADLGHLSWRHRGQWTCYPPDHIGRLVGGAVAFPAAGPGKRSTHWAADVEALGGGNFRASRDFRATRYGLLSAELTAGDGAGISVISDGTQALRATPTATWAGDRWVPKAYLVRVDDFAMGGGEGFERAHYAAELRTLKPGDVLRGAVHLRLLAGGR